MDERSELGRDACKAAGRVADAAEGVPARREKARPRDEGASVRRPADPFVRAENEDDDGYDPYSDRRPSPEPLFERDPWG